MKPTVGKHTRHGSEQKKTAVRSPDRVLAMAERIEIDKTQTRAMKPTGVAIRF